MTSLRELRERQGRTIADLAMKLGVAESTVRNWEQGRHLPQGAKIRRKIARALRVSDAELEFGPPADIRQVMLRPSAPAADLRPVIAASIVPHPQGRPEVLMTERRFATVRVWSWPAGHVRKDEQPADTVLRELNEELVVQDARVVRLLGEVDTHTDVSRYWGRQYRHGYRMFHFQVAIASPTVGLIDHEELLRAEWRSINQVREAVASLPPELAEAAVNFARQATTLDADSNAVSEPSSPTQTTVPN